MYSEQNPQSCFKRLRNGSVFDFSEKETGTKGVGMATKWQVSFWFFFVMYITGAKFEDHYLISNRAVDIIEAVLHFSWLTLLWSSVD